MLALVFMDLVKGLRYSIITDCMHFPLDHVVFCYILPFCLSLVLLLFLFFQSL